MVNPVDDLLLLEPIFVPKLWGGTRLKERYGDKAPDGPVGECLVVSGHPDSDCVVRTGPHAGRTLSELWRNEPALFSGAGAGAFPYQVKLIDAQEDLSVQVHPDAAFARAHPEAEEKNECWYTLAPSRAGKIVIGHSAKDEDELRALVEGGRWDELLTQIDMREGDFFYIPAGTAHCILGGSFIYEVMQPSNTTYRLYDFDRLDLDGTKRPLHLDSALEVLRAPHVVGHEPKPVSRTESTTATTLIDNDHFCVRRVSVTTDVRLPMDGPFLIVSVLEGSGRVNGYTVGANDHFIVPGTASSVILEGRLELIVIRP